MIAAIGDDRAIGVRGNMPWHISGDLRYFKRVTLGCPVIMGRTTYESLGRPLPGRKNIVLTGRDASSFPEGVVTARSLGEAYEACGDAERCFVIGGASVYAAAIDSMDKLYITHIHTVVVDADAYFPQINSYIWQMESRSETFTDPECGCEYEFAVYAKR